MKGTKKTLMNIIRTVFVALVIGFVYFFAMRTGQKDLKKRNAPPFFIKLLQVLTILGLIRISCIHSSILLYWLPSCFSRTDNSAYHLYPLPSLHLPAYPLEK